MVEYKLDNHGKQIVRNPLTLINDKIEKYVPLLNVYKAYDAFNQPNTAEQEVSIDKYQGSRRKNDERIRFRENLKSIMGSTREHLPFISIFELLTWCPFTKYIEQLCRDLIDRSHQEDRPTPSHQEDI
jgi:hypothetical protein